MEKADRLAGFFTHLGALHTRLQAERIAEDIPALRAFLPEVGRLNAPMMEARRQEAPRYNVFQVLKIRHYEARVHTPFLVNLLSPKGSHAQGDLFYRSFVNRVLPEEGDKLFHQWERLDVVDEQYTGDGFIDIWIRNHAQHGRYCIIIENKVFAGDQKDQLSRYYDYARSLGFDDSEIRLFYLTLWPS